MNTDAERPLVKETSREDMGGGRETIIGVRTLAPEIQDRFLFP